MYKKQKKISKCENQENKAKKAGSKISNKNKVDKLYPCIEQHKVDIFMFSLLKVIITEWVKKVLGNRNFLFINNERETSEVEENMPQSSLKK